MNDAPGRILAWTVNEWGSAWSVAPEDAAPDAVEYIRADHAQAELQAAVVAERIACADTAKSRLYPKNEPDDWTEYAKIHAAAAIEVAAAIRVRTDPGAQAALETVKREARNEVLREAAVNLKTYAPHLEYGPEHDVVYYHGYHTALNRILALMEGTDDD